MNSILIVEDEVSQREMLADYFSVDGNKMFTAGNGIEAIQIIEEEDIDIVVSDIQMPKMDGLKLVKKLARIRPELPIILATGYGTVEIAVDALKAGATDFLLKPLDLAKLSRTIITNIESMKQSRKECDLAEFVSGVITYDFPARQHCLLGVLSTRISRFVLLHGYIDSIRYHAITTVLYEAFSNAMYHGTLGVRSETLRESDSGEIDFMTEVSQRAESQEYRDKIISIELKLDANLLTVKIRDEGNGFDWKNRLQEATDPESINRAFGRGLTIINGMMGEKNYYYSNDGDLLTLVFSKGEGL